jgi:flagellar biosynthesis GTPase FlhF
MVDYKTYKSMHPKAEAFQFTSYRKVVFDRWPETIPHSAVQLDEAYLLIMPPHIHGFSFKKKNWRKVFRCLYQKNLTYHFLDSLLIENIRPVEWNKAAFDRLVLPTKVKDMVKSLVMVRAATRESKHRQLLARMRDDIISGKGNGLIMLLHGDPGTGKTLTAGKLATLTIVEPTRDFTDCVPIKR